MNVEYAAYSHLFEAVVARGSYADARERAQWPDDRVDIWLMVGDWPVIRKLPTSFDRLTILPDGTEMKTSVMNGIEIESVWGQAWFGADALLLTIDRQEERITVHDNVGDVELTYWPLP